LIFGGLAPLVATSLIAATGDSLSPSYYLIFTALLSLVGTLHDPLANGQGLRHLGLECLRSRAHGLSHALNHIHAQGELTGSPLRLR
jgi:MHS family proline/betaine transporter-like MFS transporter